MDTQQQLQEIIELLRPISDWFQQHPLRPQREEEANQGRKKSFRQEMQERVRENMELRSHARVLQQQFGLLQPPHNNRVRRYLHTNDPRVFDGLRRRRG